MILLIRYLETLLGTKLSMFSRDEIRRAAIEEIKREIQSGEKIDGITAVEVINK